MGNRTGSPPEPHRDDESEEFPENQPETDDTQQTEIGDITRPEHDDDETSSTDPDVSPDSDASYEGGVGGGGVIDGSSESEPDDAPEEDDESDEVDRQDPHPGSEEGSEPESGSEERDDTEDNELDEFELLYGDIVHDRESEPQEGEDLEDLVLVNLPDDTIAHWECDDDAETMADRNPGYPPTDSVIVVVALETLSEEIPEWDKRHEEIPLDTLDDNSIDYRGHPSLRLKLEEPSHLRKL